MKTIIIDDEQKGRKVLRTLLQKYVPDADIVGEADGVKSGEELIRSAAIDLVLLDINMRDGTGFDLLDKVRTHSFEVVFTTAHDEYAIRAFRYNALDYLLKPISRKDLLEAICKVQQRQVSSTIDSQFGHLFAPFREQQDEFISVPTQQGFRVVKIEEIMRCQAFQNYTTFHLSNGDRITVSRTLKDYETVLPEECFLRVHRSHLINKRFVKEYTRSKGGFVILTDDSEIPLSNSRKEYFLEKMGIR